MQNVSSTGLAQAFLTAAQKARPAPQGPSRPRLIFALDATMSRQPTWDLASRCVADMFAAAGGIGGLDVQLVYFQGLESFRASPFVSSALQLTNVMTGIHCRSGITQIERVLDHVRREHAKQPVSAFVYIGDAVEEDGLIAKAVGLGVKGFVFHENPRENMGAIETFKAIAAHTGGVYLPFDQDSAGKLAGLLAGIAAWATGGRAALAARDDAGSRLLLNHLK